jgi:putative isomerase
MVTFPALRAAVTKLGKPSWRPMLAYVVELHERSTHPPLAPLPHSWEEIGPGYCYGPALGHWDLVHAVLDVLPDEPEHARHQILNGLAVQSANGMLPGVIWMPRPDDPTRDKPRWSNRITHPPVWPVAVQEIAGVTGDEGIVARTYDALLRQIRWFETHRKVKPEGFYYSDILTFDWESGVDEGVRFDNVQPGPKACVDATSHLYTLYVLADSWAKRLGVSGGAHGLRAQRLRAYIQEHLFCEETGFFHDSWAVRSPSLGAEGRRPLAFDGMWPVVVGAATEVQANRVIDENLLNPERFLAPHPIPTVALSDPAFELRMWRGPTWNSMTYWAARGCLRYGRSDAAGQLLERALDQAAIQFERTGTIWEFYHPHGDDPATLQRKPHTAYNAPCRDYLGHNPLIAMARLHEAASG